MRRDCIAVALIVTAASLAAVLRGGSVFSTPKTFSVTGIVKNSLTLSAEDLRHYNPVTVRINELSRDGEFRGAFVYRGVPLKHILDMACIQKEETDFFKPVDTVILVKNAEGKQVVLSWAEVMYRQASDVLVAYEAAPVMPQKGCEGCHKKGEYERWLDPLKRVIGFPRLLLVRDRNNERCIEDICAIEAVDPHFSMKMGKTGKAHSPVIILKGADGREITVESIAGLPGIDVAAAQIGDGKGFHGLKRYRGVPVAELLKRHGIAAGPDSVLLFSAADGYRSVVSAGELSPGSSGRNIIVADTLEGEPIREMGKFNLVVPDDLSADRWVKALKRIEVISMRRRPSVNVIGVGCGDTGLITLEGISWLAKSDSVICTDDIKNRFGRYIGDRPVLFNPLAGVEKLHRQKGRDKKNEGVTRKLDELNEKNVALIRRELAAGKTVAFLEYGDPAVFGSWTYWLKKHIREEIRVIPGVSAFNAANAMLVTNVASRGSVIITAPRGLVENQGMLEAVAKNGDTMAIFVGLREAENLAVLLMKYYPENMPVTVAYKAGYSRDGALMKTTLKEMTKRIREREEQFLGLIYIGKDLD